MLPPPAPLPDEVRFDDVVVDFRSYEARKGDRRIDMTRKEFGVLQYLAAKPGEVIRRDGDSIAALIVELVQGEAGVVPAPREFAYRSRIRLKADAEGRLGFFERGSNRLVPSDRCIVAA